MATHAHGSKLTGYTLQQILNMDEYTLTHLSEEKQRAISKQLGMAANRRIKAMERKAENSPALRGVMDSGGKFTFKGKSYQDTQNDTSRALQFLKHETSTLKGWDKVKSETIDTIEKLGFSLTKEQWDVFWDAYSKVAQQDSKAKMKEVKYEVWKEIHAEMEDTSKSPEEIANSVKKLVTVTYEKNKQLEQQRKSGGVSQYFK